MCRYVGRYMLHLFHIHDANEQVNLYTQKQYKCTSISKQRNAQSSKIFPLSSP